MDINEQKTYRRLRILELAKATGNISKTCRQMNISRTQFYKYQRRYQLYGLEGLKDLPPVHKTHPQTIPPAVVKQILALSLEHPAWGCTKLSNALKALKIQVSSPTVQKILCKHNLASQADRAAKLEEDFYQKKLALSAEQIALIEKFNPVFKERHAESSRPGEVLAQAAIFIGRMNGIGKVYLHTVVDTFSSYAFGFLHQRKTPEAAVALLDGTVIPFYQEKNLCVSSIITNRSKEFCGEKNHPYELYLALNGITHRKASENNGFMERFSHTALTEFFCPILKEKIFSNLETLQTDFARWLNYYNAQRPNRGYRNMGKTPIAAIDKYCKTKN